MKRIGELVFIYFLNFKLTLLILNFWIEHELIESKKNCSN